MKYVIRMESKDGEGVYASGTWSKSGLGASISNRHPMPDSDSLFVENKNKCNRNSIFMRYCFNSFAQFRNWVFADKMIEVLNVVGVVVKLFRVDNPEADLIEGSTQCTFFRHEGIEIECVAISAFLNNQNPFSEWI